MLSVITDSLIMTLSLTELLHHEMFNREIRDKNYTSYLYGLIIMKLRTETPTVDDLNNSSLYVLHKLKKTNQYIEQFTNYWLLIPDSLMIEKSKNTVNSNLAFMYGDEQTVKDKLNAMKYFCLENKEIKKIIIYLLKNKNINNLEFIELDHILKDKELTDFFIYWREYLNKYNHDYENKIKNWAFKA